MAKLLRKGSLQLSINAIVVLVLAITLLGMGLAFTKGKFSELGGAIVVSEPGYSATEDEPLVLPSEMMEGRINRDFVFSMFFFNVEGQNDFHACVKMDGEVAIVGQDIIVAPFVLDRRRSMTVKVALKGGFLVTKGIRILEVMIARDSGTMGQPCYSGPDDIVVSKQVTLELK